MNDGIRRLIVPGRLDGVIPDNTTLEALIENSVKKAERERRLSQLCSELKAANPNEAFHVELDRCNGLDGVIAGGRPHWFDERLPVKLPLIDRENLRAGIYEMLENDPNNNRLMIVRGDSPGKSYGQWLIKHVAKAMGLNLTVFVDLLDTNVASVQKLAVRLTDAFGLPHKELQERFTTEIREGKIFNQWFAGKTRLFPPGQRWLLVFDHASKPGVPDDVAQTAIHLARLAMNVELNNVWVILIDSPDGEFEEFVDPFVDTTIEPLTPDLVQEFLDWAMELRRQAGDRNPEVPRKILDILTQQFPLPKVELGNLQREIVGWLRQRPRAEGGAP
jgi:hypothetical protein